MTQAERVATKVLGAIRKVGVSVTLESISFVYNATTRKSSEGTPVLHTVNSSDLVDEQRRYAVDVGLKLVDGTFYFAAKGLVATPKPLDRVIYLARKFKVVGVWPYRLNGTLVAWRIDVAEIGV